MTRLRHMRLEYGFYSSVEAQLTKLSNILISGIRSVQSVTESVRSYALTAVIVLLVEIPLTHLVKLTLKTIILIQERIYTLLLRENDFLKGKNGIVYGNSFVGVNNSSNAILDARKGGLGGREWVKHEASLKEAIGNFPEKAEIALIRTLAYNMAAIAVQRGNSTDGNPMFGILIDQDEWALHYQDQYSELCRIVTHLMEN